jgi:small subunit ribosomal protein S3
MDAGVSQIAIERMANMVKVTLHTARPGLIIGRGGRGIDDLRVELEKQIPRKVQINVLEVKQPELDAYLVAESVAGQIERRVSFKRAIRLAIARTMQRGGKGIKVIVGGRLGGAEIARNYSDKDGKIPLHTLRADIDYGAIEARTQYGNIGVKVWIYRGEVLPGTGALTGTVPLRPAAPRPAMAPTAAAAPVDATEKKAKGWRRVTRETAPPTADEVVDAAVEPQIASVEEVTAPEIETMALPPKPMGEIQPEASAENAEPGEPA